MDLSSPSGFTDADERIIRYLREAGADYPALVAGNTGLHVTLVERRLGLLEAEGYVEAVTGEAVYRTTTTGEEAVETLDASGSTEPESDPAVASEDSDAAGEGSAADAE